MAKADQELEQIGRGDGTVSVQIGGASTRFGAIEGAGVVIDGGHGIIVDGIRISATFQGGKATAAFTETFWLQRQRLACNGDRAVCEAVDGRGARLSIVEPLLDIPSVDGEFVLVGASVEGGGQGPHAIVVRIRHGRTIPTPTIETGIQKDRSVSGWFAQLVHVYLKGDRGALGPTWLGEDENGEGNQ